jgi:glycosyltransferase involved in cell wall biosynthesis
MKVLHVETGRHLYGGALQVRFLLEGLAAGWPGDRHVLVCPRGAAIAAAVRGRVRVVELELGGDLDLGMAVRLRRLFADERPDVVHLHSRRGADLWGALAARSLGIPVVLSRRVDNPEPRPLVALKYRLYDQVVTISQGIRDVLLREGVPAAKVTCVPSAVDTRTYRPGGDRGWLNAEFGLPADALVVAMAAQFIPRKGHDTLLAALPPVLERHPRLRVLLFGQGPLRDEVSAEVQRRGWADRVLLPGFRDDLARILPALDVLVHPARMEGLGVVLLQAAACGIPLVAARAGGIPEVCIDGETGWLVQPGDAAGLAAALDAGLSDPVEARRRGAAGRALVERAFSVEAMVAGNRAVYEKLLQMP